jgi:hypothetical protein
MSSKPKKNSRATPPKEGQAQEKLRGELLYPSLFILITILLLTSPAPNSLLAFHDGLGSHQSDGQVTAAVHHGLAPRTEKPPATAQHVELMCGTSSTSVLGGAPRDGSLFFSPTPHDDAVGMALACNGAHVLAKLAHTMEVEMHEVAPPPCFLASLCVFGVHVG